MDCSISNVVATGVQVEAVKCEVKGTLPSWLKGYLITNGPGTFEPMSHLFSGFGMVRKLTFDGEGGALF